MRALVQLAAVVQDFLESQKWRYCFIGGLAVQHWGEPRLTRDIDLTIFTGFTGEAEVVRRLLASFAGRIEHAEDFALQHRVVLLKSEDGIAIDVSLGGFPFEEQAVDRAIKVPLGAGHAIKLCTAEDLIIYKAFASREQDWRDVRGIIVRQGSHRLDWEYITPHIELLASLKEEPEICRRLTELRNTVK